MKKRLLSMLLVLVMVMAMLPVSVMAEELDIPVLELMETDASGDGVQNETEEELSSTLTYYGPEPERVPLTGDAYIPVTKTGAENEILYFTVAEYDVAEGEHFCGWKGQYGEDLYPFGGVQPGVYAGASLELTAVVGTISDGLCGTCGKCFHSKDADGYCTETMCTHVGVEELMGCCELRPTPSTPVAPPESDDEQEGEVEVVLARPSVADLTAALADKVKVVCENWNHATKYYGCIDEDAVTVTDVAWNAKEEAYCCAVFINDSMYVAKYNEDVGAEHTYSNRMSNAFNLKYDENTESWVCLESELVLKVDCLEDPIQYYVINASAGKHGDVSSEGVSFITPGADKTYYFYPDKGYEVSAVYVDGYLVNYYGVCADHHWNCKGCDDCWWIDWSRWYDDEHKWCDHDDCGYWYNGYWYAYDNCDHWYDSCYWGNWENSITFYDVEDDHSLYVEFAKVAKDCASAYYWDLDTDAWYHEATDFVIDKGLMKGVGNKSFDPYGATTRGELVTMLYRLAGEPAVSGSSEFADVAAKQWYTNAVIWAAQKGIVTGYGDGTFGVEDVVTREQTVAILYRYAKWAGCDVSDLASLLNFVDVDEVSEYAEKPFGWAVEEDVIEGKPVSGWKLKLDPQGITERVEMAAMLMRFVKFVD